MYLKVIYALSLFSALNNPSLPIVHYAHTSINLAWYKNGSS